MKTRQDLLNQLKAEPKNYREILPNLFNLIDPNKKYYKELIWLMAIPDEALKNVHSIATEVTKKINVVPETLGQLNEDYPIGTLFVDIETNTDYTLAGKMNEDSAQILCKPFTGTNTKLLVMLNANTRIKYLF